MPIAKLATPKKPTPSTKRSSAAKSPSIARPSNSLQNLPPKSAGPQPHTPTTTSGQKKRTASVPTRPPASSKKPPSHPKPLPQNLSLCALAALRAKNKARPPNQFPNFTSRSLLQPSHSKKKPQNPDLRTLATCRAKKQSPVHPPNSPSLPPVRFSNQITQKIPHHRTPAFAPQRLCEKKTKPSPSNQLLPPLLSKSLTPSAQPRLCEPLRPSVEKYPTSSTQPNPPPPPHPRLTNPT